MPRLGEVKWGNDTHFQQSYLHYCAPECNVHTSSAVMFRCNVLESVECSVSLPESLMMFCSSSYVSVFCNHFKPNSAAVEYQSMVVVVSFHMEKAAC